MKRRIGLMNLMKKRLEQWREMNERVNCHLETNARYFQHLI